MALSRTIPLWTRGFSLKECTLLAHSSCACRSYHRLSHIGAHRQARTGAAFITTQIWAVGLGGLARVHIFFLYYSQYLQYSIFDYFRSLITLLATDLFASTYKLISKNKSSITYKLNYLLATHLSAFNSLYVIPLSIVSLPLQGALPTANPSQFQSIS
jgi:hypothetical protein